MNIDLWTLALQALNVLILVWLLQWLFWRPVAGMIAARRAATQAAIDVGVAKQAEAEAALAEIALTREGFAAERAAILAAARADAAAATRAAAARAEAAAKAAREAAEASEARAEAEREKARHAAAAALAVDIARRLLGRLDGGQAQAAFLARLIAELRAMSPEAHRAAALRDAALELVTAKELPPEAQTRAGAEIAAATGGAPTLTFRTDPDLIAGAELRGAHFTLCDSWRADLARIEAELRNEG